MEIFKCRWSVSQDKMDGHVQNRVVGMKLWSTFTTVGCRVELLVVFQWRPADTIHSMQNHKKKGQNKNWSMLWGHIALVVRDYNQILHDLLPLESCLFEDIIHILHQQLQSGLLKLSWIFKGTVGWYLAKCQWLCAKTYRIVTNVQGKKKIISINCKKFSFL